MLLASSVAVNQPHLTADLHETDEGFVIEYYSDGTLIKTESVSGTIVEATNKLNTWATEVRQLNG